MWREKACNSQHESRRENAAAKRIRFEKIILLLIYILFALSCITMYSVGILALIELLDRETVLAIDGELGSIDPVYSLSKGKMLK